MNESIKKWLKRYGQLLYLFPSINGLSISYFRVAPVSWRESRISRTSDFLFAVLRPSVCMPIRSPPSGPSSRPFCSLATCVSAPMRFVFVEKMAKNRHFQSCSLATIPTHSERVIWSGSHLQWGGGSESGMFVADFLRGTADCHHSQSNSKYQCTFGCQSHINTKTERQMISFLHRRPSMTGFTAPYLLKVPLNPGKKFVFTSCHFFLRRCVQNQTKVNFEVIKRFVTRILVICFLSCLRPPHIMLKVQIVIQNVF